MTTHYVTVIGYGDQVRLKIPCKHVRWVIHRIVMYM